MSSRPYMKMFWSDYLTDTAHMTLEEHGLYLLMIAAYWNRGGALPSDPVEIARIVNKDPRQVRRLLRGLLRHFSEKSGTLLHKRVEQELENARAKSLKARKAGIASADSRSQRSLNVLEPERKRLSTPPSTSETLSSPLPLGQPQSHQRPADRRSLADLEPPGGDWGVLVWEHGLRMLTDRGALTVTGARKLLGKWQRDLNGDKRSLWRMFIQCDQQGAFDPQAYIAKAVLGAMREGQDPARPHEPPPVVLEHPSRWSPIRWTSILQVAAERKSWPAMAGPAPWDSGCLCPRDLVDKHRALWEPLQPKKRRG